MNPKKSFNIFKNMETWGFIRIPIKECLGLSRNLKESLGAPKNPWQFPFPQCPYTLLMNSAPLSTVDIAMVFLIKLLCTMGPRVASSLEHFSYIILCDHHHCTKKRKDWPNVLLGFTSLSAASRLARNLNSQLPQPLSSSIFGSNYIDSVFVIPTIFLIITVIFLAPTEVLCVATRRYNL